MLDVACLTCCADTSVLSMYIQNVSYLSIYVCLFFSIAPSLLLSFPVPSLSMSVSVLFPLTPFTLSSFIPCLFCPAAVWMRMACDLQEAYLTVSGAARRLGRLGATADVCAPRLKNSEFHIAV
jgi:hypothetical protein